MRYVFYFLAFSFSLLAETPEYDFAGRHFLASYLDCDKEALSDVEALSLAMDLAVQSSGATLLDKCEHLFPPHGLTLLYLLSESHASIHTYPEHGACFVDLFTCGDHCSAEEFDRVLRTYLQPQNVDSHLFTRGEKTRLVSCSEGHDRGPFR